VVEYVVKTAELISQAAPTTCGLDWRLDNQAKGPLLLLSRLLEAAATASDGDDDAAAAWLTSVFMLFWPKINFATCIEQFRSATLAT